ncbi:hypothetical protein KVP40.0088 [Vibrio phage KVP40]|uniref:Uncharacterized protein n=3 Tax=Schizotequatrovirus KVP40 TaxID=1914019 RepID=Q6WI64_BPKVM|nr:hypothetical protein KVP40.0088 [Vibrio phage KVP40]AFN37320.1 hypothetical protein pp2_087 [Vibrio phage phi-pp2]QIW90946.1 hypothetical protein COHAPHLL_00083 [Vibrio phage V09]UNA01989.1 hypothetical protein [Vibrio phage PC-Liy1]URQ03286.1 hypothetical protein PVA8_300 [Vibrio phage PVA8]WBM59021.1 hypothetical protein vBValMPVA8_299 [Vibrio phage vB_ValM_PVA8]WOL24999.1 hypothetical protein [Vibrio phage PG216]
MIQFKRRNLVPDNQSPLWAYDSVDALKSDDLNERNFYNNVTGETHNKLRITRGRFDKKWVLRATSKDNDFKLLVVADDFKTKKEAIEYVNDVYLNTKGL